MNDASDVNKLINLIVLNLRKFNYIKSILLVGSQARGDANEYSDIDLIIITDGYFSITDINKVIPIELHDKRLSLLPYPSEIFDELYKDGTLFMFHIINEGIILYDDGFFKNLKIQPFKFAKEDLSIQWNKIKYTMLLYKDLKIYGGIYITCLSEIFSIIKNISIISSAIRGDYEFNKNLSLKKLESYYPYLKEDIEELSKLKIYYLNWIKDIPMSINKDEIYSKKFTIKYIKKLNKIIKEVEINEFK